MAPGDQSSPPNKRKRAGADQGASRPSPSIRSAAAAAAAAAAASQADQATVDQAFEENLSQLIAHNSGAHDLHQNGGPTPSATETAQAALTHYQVPPSFENPAVGTAPDPNGPFGMEHASFALDQLKDAAGQAPPPSQAPETAVSQAKPPVGSEEWHRIRRDNHKEVERRRREAINEGINELSKIVPGCEKNKGSILQRAVQYIGQIKENEQANIEKWTLEKLLLDQAINELSTTAERLEADLKYVSRERDIYKRACEENDISPPEIKELENEVKAASGE